MFYLKAHVAASLRFYCENTRMLRCAHYRKSCEKNIDAQNIESLAKTSTKPGSIYTSIPRAHALIVARDYTDHACAQILHVPRRSIPAQQAGWRHSAHLCESVRNSQEIEPTLRRHRSNHSNKNKGRYLLPTKTNQHRGTRLHIF